MSELAWKELTVEEKEWRAKWFTDGLTWSDMRMDFWLEEELSIT